RSADVGHDLGTSNSAAAVLRGGRPVMIPSAEGLSLGGKAFPSYVAVTSQGEVIVGEPARRQVAANPDGTASAFKRKMGQRDKTRLKDREFTPEELSSLLLQKIKRDAESFLGEPVNEAVVTVPAYFNDNQRSATKDAARIAGLDVKRLVNEPTAASLAYGLDRSGEDMRVAVIDFGGGTLDVTIMEFGKGVFEVKATSGDTQLGGTDMDKAVFEFLVDKFREKSGIDVRGDVTAAARLREAGEMAKIELSSTTTTRISLPFLATKDGIAQNFDFEFKRAELDHLVRPIVERCRTSVVQAMHDAQVSERDIDRLIFVGGPTRMPVVREFFESVLGRKAEMGVDPMECVAQGAAIQAGVLAGEVDDIVLVDVTPLTLGIETLGGVATPLIARNTPVPVKRSEIFTTAADMQTSVTVHVFQGERPMAADNTSLGQFNLEGLAPAPRGTPKIEVEFDIDADGILDATAKDMATGKSQSIRITGSTRLSATEKERMVRQAEQFADDDKKRREAADKLNNADSICYQAERTLGDFADKISSDLKGRVDTALRETRDAIAGEDPDKASEKSEALKVVLQEIGMAVYAETPEAGPQPRPDVTAGNGEPRPSGAGPGGRVVDAEYREAGSAKT
ncbi:MAG: molecular chaperone DnaK, partial [Hyphomicrobiaceae bacterium]